MRIKTINHAIGLIYGNTWQNMQEFKNKYTFAVAASSSVQNQNASSEVKGALLLRGALLRGALLRGALLRGALLQGALNGTGSHSGKQRSPHSQ